MKFGKRFRMPGGAKNIAIFDIGSGSVGSALVKLQPHEVPVILQTTRIPIAFQSDYKADRLLLEMVRSLKENIKEFERLRALQRGEGGRLAEIHVVFASPWHSSRTHLVRVQHEKQFEVTEKFLEDTMHKAKEQFSTSGDASATFGGQQVRLEERIIQTALNGYPTSEPYGKKAAKLDAAIYLSLIDDTVRRDVITEIERVTGNTEVLMHSFLLLAFLTAREVHPLLTDYLLVDISSEVTDIGLVRDGVFLESASFPWGRNYILRELAIKLGTIPEEAHTLLRLPEAGEAKRVDGKVEQARSAVKEVWLKAFEQTCAELTETGQLPFSVLLTTAPDLAQWFTSILSSNVGSRYTYTHEPFHVTALGGSDIVKHLRLVEGVSHDPFLALEAVALEGTEFFLRH